VSRTDKRTDVTAVSVNVFMDQLRCSLRDEQLHTNSRRRLLSTSTVR